MIKSRLIKKFGGLKAASRNLALVSYDALRQDLSKNRFFEDDLKRLCREVDFPCDLESLKRTYDFTVKTVERGPRHVERLDGGENPTLSDAFGVIDARMDRIRRMVAPAREVVPRFFEAMGPKDLLVMFISDELPVHWIGPESASWGATICKAVTKGAMILYLYPNDELCNAIQNGCSASMAGERAVRPEFASFKQRLLSLGLEESKLNNLAILECGNPAVFTPQHRFGLYFHHGKTANQLRGTEAIPVWLDASADEPPSRFWVLSSSRRFTSYLKQVCERTLNSELDNLKKLGARNSQQEQESAAERLALLRQILDRCYFK